MIKRSGRYDTTSLAENQFEPGSRNRVLKNLAGIKRKREMDECEAREQLRALKELVAIYDSAHRFTATDICEIHTMWLGGVYEWAGNYRQVNISKGGFSFAMAAQISKLMTALEQGSLQNFTPCRFTELDEIISALAEVHTELVLIHPFRDGNGRVARMLAILMGLQAGLPPLNFDIVTGKTRDEYFAAVQAGMDYNYEPMKKIFEAVVRKTLRLGGLFLH